jgi:pyridinium-3,5-biscarboxylic acid mononucleotide synthase
VSRALDLGYATIDLDRTRRQGVPEVVYAPGKTPAEIDGIVTALLAHDNGPVLVTRLDAAPAAALTVDGGRYDAAARVMVWRPAPPRATSVAVVTAGTADGPVAAEAAAVAGAIGLRVTEIRDVGVAGLHRITARAGELADSDVVIVIAGMEGALASVVAGLVACPVVAVPTSTGYGAALEGITALLAMLSSCANGITVVNIDSGYAAAMAAHRLAVAMERAGTNRPGS